MEFLQINFGIIAEDPITKASLHFVGYKVNPVQDDFDSLEKELKTDEQLGMKGQPFDLRRATTREVLSYRELLHTQIHS